MLFFCHPSHSQAVLTDLYLMQAMKLGFSDAGPVGDFLLGGLPPQIIGQLLLSLAHLHHDLMQVHGKPA